MASGMEESSFMRHTSDTNCKERDQGLGLHFKFSVAQNTSKAVKRGVTDRDNIMFMRISPYTSREKKGENIYSPLEKWEAERKQITDSETLIANKMLNLLAVREIQIKQ